MPSNDVKGGARFKFLPLSIRLETLGGIATPLVLTGTPLPAKRSEVFSTAVDNQSAITVHVLIGESPFIKRCMSIGKVDFQGIPAAPKGIPQVRVTFKVDQRCGVYVTASVNGTPLEGSGDLIPDTKHLTDQKIQDLRATAAQYDKEDQHRVSVIEAVRSAEDAIQRAEQQLATDTAQGNDRKRIAERIAALGRALETEDVERIRECTRALEAKSSVQASSFDDIFGNVFGDFFSRPPARAPQQAQPARTGSKARPADPARPGAAVARPASHPPLGKIFGGGDFTLDPTLCLVPMPFADTFRPIYEDHIRPIVQGEGLTCLRADEIRGTSLITRDIWEKINRARLLVADLTGQNPNVFYEVGLAHALGEDVLLLTQTMTDVPFDLKAMRCIVYNYTPRGMTEMEVALHATVSALTKSG